MKIRLKWLSVVIAALLCMTALLAGCAKDGKETRPEYSEPVVSETENYRWIDDSAPMVQFGEPADTIVYFDGQERTMSDDIRQLLSCLKALVNGKEVRLFVGDNDEAQGINGWIDRLGYRERTITMDDPWEVVEYFKDDLSKEVVIYDSTVMETIDLACTYAGINDCLALSFPMYAQLVERGYDVEIVEDYRGRFADKFEAYSYLYDELWPQCTHRILISEHVDYTGYLRSFGMLIKAASVWLDVRDEREAEMMAKFVDDMPAGEACIYGWYASEGDGVQFGSERGVWTYAADWLENIEFFAHETEIVAPVRSEETFTEASDVDYGTVYVALALSEGDNLTFDLASMYNLLYSDPNFGDFPLSLSISPTSSVMMPEVMNWYYANAGDNIGFMTGPSGVGYTYTNSWEESNMEGLRQYFATTNKYCKRAGIEVVNNWTASGAWDTKDISDAIRDLMEAEYTDILAVVDQGSNTRLTHDNGLLIAPMACGYTQVTQDMNDIFRRAIATAVAETEMYKEPTFVYLQGNPWTNRSVQDLWELVQEIERTYPNVKFVRVDECARAQRLFWDMQATRGGN